MGVPNPPGCGQDLREFFLEGIRKEIRICLWNVVVPEELGATFGLCLELWQRGQIQVAKSFPSQAHWQDSE